MPARSTKACISSQACDQITPLPETMIGCFAVASASTRRFTCAGSPSGRASRIGRPHRLQSISSSGMVS
jgi:hypothetical protein